MLRSKVNWETKAEMPTKYFLNLEKKQAQSKTLHRLQWDDGSYAEGMQVLSEIKEYYNNLSASSGPINTDFVDELEIPKLDADLKNELEQPLTEEELGFALYQLANQQSPGLDGIPCEWYKMFWGKIKHIYTGVVQEMIQDGEMHLSTCRGYFHY